MKRLTVLAQLALAALILILLAPVSQAAQPNLTDPIVREIFMQHVANATQAGMPAASRPAADILAAKALASGPGSNINPSAQSQARLDPQASLLHSDTSYYWNIDHWEPDSRTNYTYIGDKTSSTVFEYWDGVSWVNSTKFIYGYDGSGNWTSYLYQTWDGSEWVDQFRYTITYVDNLPIGTLAEQWTGLAWENSNNSVLTYDASLRLETIITQTWVETVWLDLFRSTYGYDVNGDQTLVLSQFWAGTVWVNEFQTISVYDASHRKISSTSQIWNAGTSSWQDIGMTEYVYDVAGNQILSRNSTWSGLDWIVIDVDTMKYNGSKQNIQTVHVEVPSGELSRDDYNYDSQGNLVLNIFYIWSGDEWVPDSRSVWVYDAGANFMCGDANSSGQVNITDAVFLVNYIFAGGPPPNPLLAGDSNCSGVVNITDAVFLVNYIFGGGPAPCASCQ